MSLADGVTSREEPSDSRVHVGPDVISLGDRWIFPDIFERHKDTRQPTEGVTLDKWVCQIGDDADSLTVYVEIVRLNEERKSRSIKLIILVSSRRQREPSTYRVAVRARNSNANGGDLVFAQPATLNQQWSTVVTQDQLVGSRIVLCKAA